MDDGVLLLAGVLLGLIVSMALDRLREPALRQRVETEVRGALRWEVRRELHHVRCDHLYRSPWESDGRPGPDATR